MTQIVIIKTDADNRDFISLVHMLDEELQVRDGMDHTFYKQFNKTDDIKYTVVAYLDNIPVGCGAIKHFNESTMEVKRMFVRFEMRGQRIAGKILGELEKWAVELGYSHTILETGYKQPEAIRLYEKNDYKTIPNYGQYIGIDNSICMTKFLL